MSTYEWLARADRYLRPLAAQYLPPRLTVKLYSLSRPVFQKRLSGDIPLAPLVPEALARQLWGITFRSPIFNAAGMFKNGEGYQLVAAQGAGAYLAGTTTGPARQGNSRDGVYLPFAPYSRSESSSNWLGLPNDGDEAVAARLAFLPRVSACPVGASIMGSPDLEGQAKLDCLARGLRAYERAGVDFIEINESCPNTEQGRPQENELSVRLRFIEEAFLRTRSRRLPVVVKFSVDTDPAQIDDLVAMLIERGFDGITLGNTSTQYAKHRHHICLQEQALYDFFTTTFGGGLGGAVVRESAVALVQAASKAVVRHAAGREFHVIRAGGVLGAADVVASLAAGASLVQWYTGYYERFAESGHALYERLYAELAPLL